MGMTFSIGGVSFAELDMTTGRKALAFLPGPEEYDHRVFHVPGERGNYVVDCGKSGQKFVCRMRYIGPLATVYANLRSDWAAWDNADVTIVDPAGTTVTSRGRLESGGASIVRLPQPCSGSNVSLDAEVKFTCDD